MHRKTTISVMDGNALYRSMLTRMIATIDGFVFDRMYADLDSARALLTEPSDVVIIDLEAGPPELVFRFLRALTETGGVSVIACSQKVNDALMRQAFTVGVNGYIIKDSSYDEFRANLALALNGGMPVSRSIMRRLVDVVRRDFSSPSGIRQSEPVSMACRLIEEVLSSPFSLRQENLSDYLSRRIGLSYHQHSLQFKREMGINLSQYVIVKRIDRVKSMIMEDQHSLTQIANHMDYSSVAHLSAQFRKITGQSPSDFRRSASMVM